MQTKRRKAAPLAPTPTNVQAMFRFPRSLIQALDEYTTQLNEGRDWPHLTRADVVRGVLQWAVKTHPHWEGTRRRVA
jgi:hypothetical protein